MAQGPSAQNPAQNAVVIGCLRYLFIPRLPLDPNRGGYLVFCNERAPADPAARVVYRTKVGVVYPCNVPNDTVGLSKLFAEKGRRNDERVQHFGIDVNRCSRIMLEQSLM